MASKSNVQAFLAGSALTASLLYLFQKAQRSASLSSNGHPKTKTGRTSPNVNQRNTADNSSQLMDSPSLDQRMIRKAEGAIRNRTSRLVIVVERCTNDHNYVSSVGCVTCLQFRFTTTNPNAHITHNNLL